MAATYEQYAADGTNRNFGVPFTYLDKSHVQVSIDGVIAPSYTWVNSGMIQLPTAPAQGSVVDVRRVTPTDKPPVDFTDGSVLSETELDLLATYSAYLAQEANDKTNRALTVNSTGAYDLQGRGMINAAAATRDDGIPNKGQMDTAVAEANQSASTATTKASEAATSASNASGSAGQAATSASNASASATLAGQHKTAAETAASTATTKASQAADSATLAGQHKDTATTKASQAADSATLAGQHKDSAGTSASTATTKASEAATSATNARASELGAKAAVDRISGRNRVINGNFAINQRKVTGTVNLAAGKYGHDRWKAGAGGCTYTFAQSGPNVVITISAGSLIQVIPGEMVTDGVHAVSNQGTAPVRCSVGAAAPSGSYANATTASPVATPAATAGANLSVEFGVGTLDRIQVELGTVATPPERVDPPVEWARCRWFFRSFMDSALPLPKLTGQTSRFQRPTWLFDGMRATPTVTYYGISGTPGYLKEFSTDIDYAVTDSSGFLQVGATTTNDLVLKAIADAEL